MINTGNATLNEEFSPNGTSRKLEDGAVHVCAAAEKSKVVNKRR
jgi:hypothetical protein